jgi:DNA-binding PadR family transcriptional regulator
MTMSDTSMMYVRVRAGDVVVTDVDDEPGAKPQEVYRITPDGKETWLDEDWRDLARGLVGDESTHHSGRSAISRAAQKIQEIYQRENQ